MGAGSKQYAREQTEGQTGVMTKTRALIAIDMPGITPMLGYFCINMNLI